NLEVTVTKVTDPSHGTLTLNPDGSFIYQPDPDFVGTDSFLYGLPLPNLAADQGGLLTEKVEIVAEPLPTPTSDNYSTDEDTALPVAAPGVLDNDSGDPLQAILVSGPAHGALTLNADGSFSYLPHAEFNGEDTFTYELAGGLADVNATVTIDVKPVNDV